jgi:ATP-dependent DNA helicase RecG
MPKGRLRVDTYVVDESYRDRLNTFIERQIALGGQCYIVCPSIDRDGDEGELFSPDAIEANGNISYSLSSKLKNAVEYSEDLRKVFPNIRIEYMHGRMKSSEKDEIMSEFAAGKIQILVSTTVIEVGVNVPNASLMIVENAERFGLSQLHQLRGRVGRGQRKSYCVLVSDSKSEKSLSRLNVMKTTYDGYEIAEKDLLQRGPGDFFLRNSSDNIRQSGGFDFKFASMCDDTDLFSSAFATAKQIINADPNLDLPIHKGLKEAVIDKLNASSSTIS